MKKVYSLLLTMTITTLSLFAQPPQKMSYQAVIRDNGNQLVVNNEIGMQVSILQGSANGTAVYVETQTPTTNANGLVSIEIGGDDATVVSGNFASIDWSDGPWFIKTDTDPSGGTNYTITGTSQLLSVPYALHSGTADILTGEITESQISDLQDYLTEETDPLFTGHPASGIEAADIENWDEAHGWGDHADEGYLKEETDPVFEASPAAGIESEDIGNWDEAHGWGDHAAEGYLKEETDPSVPKGTTVGEMQYWDGTSWVTFSPGTTGQVLTFVDGIPAWEKPAIPTVGTTDVYNHSTGKVWMDRNLGASRVAQSSNDPEAYGDLYQWGRDADGHQIRTSPTTSIPSNSDTPGHGDFILAPDQPCDWRNPQNDNLWQGVSGVNNPCPAGYRLPTEAEWDAERQSWSSNNAAGAFASPLKLTVAGHRNLHHGLLSLVGSYGVYWSGAVVGALSRIMYFGSTGTPHAGMLSDYRAHGFSVRCIKD